MKKAFGSLPLWQAVLVLGTVVAVSVYLVNMANKPKMTA